MVYSINILNTIDYVRKPNRDYLVGLFYLQEVATLADLPNEFRQVQRRGIGRAETPLHIHISNEEELGRFLIHNSGEYNLEAIVLHVSMQYNCGER